MVAEGIGSSVCGESWNWRGGRWLGLKGVVEVRLDGSDGGVEGGVEAGI
jgi:hypothetical protein